VLGGDGRLRAARFAPREGVGMTPRTWDETFNPRVVANKAIDTSFLVNMSGDLCDAEYRDGWDRLQFCVRVAGHTGRHLATEWKCRYPTAVWE
jgi:hypothetical protein